MAVGVLMDMRSGNLDGLNVLIADGEPFVRRNVAAALRDLGLSVFEARRGEETLEVISFVRISAMVLDVSLPDYGGLETVRVIRTFQRVPPYVLLAEEATRELQVTALESLATSVVPKPVDVGLVTDLVRTMLMRALL